MVSSNMRIIFFTIVSAALIAFIITFNSNNPRATDNVGLTEDDVKKLIKEYIQNNPQEIIDSLTQHQINQQRLEEEQAAKNISEKIDEIHNNPVDPIAGNPQGNVTITEFFDYSCGYCKKIMPYIAEIIKEDPNVKVVFKEVPILGPNSVQAAKASLAVNLIAPDKYFDFHTKLMNKRITGEDSILQEAENLGIDTTEVKAKMESDEVKNIIRQTKELADSIGVRGTPALVIGKQFYPGAIDISTMKQAIARERAQKE